MSGGGHLPVGDVPFAPHPRLGVAKAATVKAGRGRVGARPYAGRPIRLSVRVSPDLAQWLASQCGEGVDPSDMIRAILVDAMAEDLGGAS
jgi:hypothetical protein